MKNKLKKQMRPLKQNFSVDEAADKLFNDIRSMIDVARNQVCHVVNTGLTCCTGTLAIEYEKTYWGRNARNMAKRLLRRCRNN